MSSMSPPQIKCPNPKCGQLRSVTDRYCGACGSALQADVRELVKWALEEQTKDREVLQVETAKAIAEKVWNWGRLFGSIAGVSTAFFVIALAVVGFKSTADIDRSRTEAQVASAKAKAEADKSASDAKDSIKEMTADLQKRLDDIETKRKEVIAQFELEKGQLDEVGKKLPALVKRIDGVVARLDTTEPQLARLDKKVGELEDKFVGKPLEPALRNRLKQQLVPFRQYLETRSLRGSRDDIPFNHGGPAANDQIAYFPTDPKIVIGSYFLNDEQFLDAPAAIAREFAHHVLFMSLTDTVTREDVSSSLRMTSLESGLADYYVASWTNSPSLYQAVAAVLKQRGEFDKDEIRNLKNGRSLKDLQGLPAFDAVGGGEIWGSVFWELREKLGPSVTDNLLSGAWQSIRPEDVKEDPLAIAKWLRDKLVELAIPQEGGKHVETIRKVFERRGLSP